MTGRMSDERGGIVELAQLVGTLSDDQCLLLSRLITKAQALARRDALEEAAQCVEATGGKYYNDPARFYGAVVRSLPQLSTEEVG